MAPNSPHRAPSFPSMVREDSDKENSNAKFHERLKDLESASPSQYSRSESASSRGTTIQSGWVPKTKVLKGRLNGQSCPEGECTPRDKSSEEKGRKESERTPRDTVVLRGENLAWPKQKTRENDDDFISISDEYGSPEASFVPQETVEDIEEMDLTNYEQDDEEEEDEFPESDSMEQNGDYEGEVVQRGAKPNQEDNVDEEEELQDSARGDEKRDVMSVAYSNMIRGAAPLGTTGKKRSRTIVASDASRNNEPMFPQLYPDPNQGPAKRLREESENRRYSAPSNLQDMSNFTPAVLKSEPLGPKWMRDGIANLVEKFPGSLLEPDNSSVKCLDCQRSFKTTMNRSFNPVEIHLRAKTHQNKVDERREKERYHQNNAFASTTNGMTMDYDIMAQPLTAFPHQERYESSKLLEQYFQARKKEDTLDTLQAVGVSQQRVALVEQRINPLENQMTEIIQVSKTGEEKYQSLFDRQREAEDAHRRDFKGIDKRLWTYERHQDDKITNLESLIAANGPHVQRLNALEATSCLHSSELQTREREDERLQLGLQSLRQSSDKLLQQIASLQQQASFRNQQLQQHTKQFQQLSQQQQNNETRLAQEVERLEAQNQSQDRFLHRHVEREEQARVEQENFNQTLLKQMTAQFAQYESRLQIQKEESEARIQKLEIQTDERDRAMKQSHDELEEKLEHLTTGIKGLEQGLATLLKTFNESMESIDANFDENDEFTALLSTKITNLIGSIEPLSTSVAGLEEVTDPLTTKVAALNGKAGGRPATPPSTPINNFAIDKIDVANSEDFTALLSRVEKLEEQLQSQGAEISSTLPSHSKQLARFNGFYGSLKEDIQKLRTVTRTDIPALQTQLEDVIERFEPVHSIIPVILREATELRGYVDEVADSLESGGAGEEESPPYVEPSDEEAIEVELEDGDLADEESLGSGGESSDEEPVRSELLGEEIYDEEPEGLSKEDVDVHGAGSVMGLI